MPELDTCVDCGTRLMGSWAENQRICHACVEARSLVVQMRQDMQLIRERWRAAVPLEDLDFPWILNCTREDFGHALQYGRPCSFRARLHAELRGYLAVMDARPSPVGACVDCGALLDSTERSLAEMGLICQSCSDGRLQVLEIRRLVRGEIEAVRNRELDVRDLPVLLGCTREELDQALRFGLPCPFRARVLDALRAYWAEAQGFDVGSGTLFPLPPEEEHPEDPESRFEPSWPAHQVVQLCTRYKLTRKRVASALGVSLEDMERYITTPGEPGRATFLRLLHAYFTHPALLDHALGSRPLEDVTWPTVWQRLVRGEDFPGEG